jgi:carboxylesterase
LTEAFRIAGGTRGAVLLVHGFTGTPHEMRPLAEPLASAGFDVLGVRLPGHGAAPPGEPNDWPAWQHAVETGLGELEAASGSRSLYEAGGAVVIGLSMGALLALDLAARVPERVRAVVALSPAITLPLPVRLLLRAGDRLGTAAFRRRLLPRGRSDIRDPAVRETHPKSAPFPVAAALSFNALRRAVRSRVAAVAQPLLIVHSRLDRTCPLAGAHWLAGAAQSAEIELHVLERSGHVIPVDLERERALELILDFVERRTSAARTERPGSMAGPPVQTTATPARARP